MALDEYIDLLAGIDWKRRTIKSVDNLEHPRVNPFAIVASQRFFGDHIGLDADEGQGDLCAGHGFEGGHS